MGTWERSPTLSQKTCRARPFGRAWPVRKDRPYGLSVSRGVPLGELLPHLVHIPLKHKQAIGVAVGIGEVVLFAFANLDLQVLVQIVHDELLEIPEPGAETIVLVVGVVANALRRRHQLPLARSHAVLVDDRKRRVETHLFEADGDVSRARLDVDRLDDTV